MSDEQKDEVEGHPRVRWEPETEVEGHETKMDDAAEGSDEAVVTDDRESDSEGHGWRSPAPEEKPEESEGHGGRIPAPEQVEGHGRGWPAPEE